MVLVISLWYQSTPTEYNEENRQVCGNSFEQNRHPRRGNTVHGPGMTGADLETDMEFVIGPALHVTL